MRNAINHYLKAFFALLVSLAMIITCMMYSFTVFAYAETEPADQGTTIQEPSENTTEKVEEITEDTADSGETKEDPGRTKDSVTDTTPADAGFDTEEYLIPYRTAASADDSFELAEAEKLYASKMGECFMCGKCAHICPKQNAGCADLKGGTRGILTDVIKAAILAVILYFVI